MLYKAFNFIFRTEPAKKAWYALRKRASPSPWVPSRDDPSYRTRIWGTGGVAHKACHVPKLIWTYWTGEASATVNACIRSWSTHNPDHRITVVTDSTVRSYIPNFPNLKPGIPPQKVSNLIRLMLLEKFGGTWIDASTLLTNSISWITSELSNNHCEAAAFWNERPEFYRRSSDRPIIENGFISATPNSKFITRWKQIYLECITSTDYRTYFHNHQNYRDILDNFKDRREERISYLVCYLAAQQIMLESDQYRLLLINAEDEFYYYYYNTKISRNRRHFSETLLLSNESECDTSKVIKITKGHRWALDEHLAYGCYQRNSLLGKYF